MRTVVYSHSGDRLYYIDVLPPGIAAGFCSGDIKRTDDDEAGGIEKGKLDKSFVKSVFPQGRGFRLWPPQEK